LAVVTALFASLPVVTDKSASSVVPMLPATIDALIVLVLLIAS